MKIIADLNDKQEKTLKNIKRISYICGWEVTTKPQQIAMGLDLLQKIMDNTSEAELINLIKDGE